MRYLMEVYTDERAQQQRLEEDVRQGLTARQKSLPPKYLYDLAGPSSSSASPSCRNTTRPEPSPPCWER